MQVLGRRCLLGPLDARHPDELHHEELRGAPPAHRDGPAHGLPGHQRGVTEDRMRRPFSSIRCLIAQIHDRAVTSVRLRCLKALKNALQPLGTLGPLMTRPSFGAFVWHSTEAACYSLDTSSLTGCKVLCEHPGDRALRHGRQPPVYASRISCLESQSDSA